MVAFGWLASIALFCCVCLHIDSLASICKQQKICVFYFIFEVDFSYLSLASTLAMSDEIAQDEEDAEDYDLEALNRRTRARDDDDNATLVADRGRGGPAHPEVVFEIGDEDPGSDGEDHVSAKQRRLSVERHGSMDNHERQGLMGDNLRDD